MPLDLDMPRPLRRLRASGAVFALALAAAAAAPGRAQESAAPAVVDSAAADAPARQPDVHFVPTPMEVVDQMLAFVRPTRDDVVYDLGCGDGRIVVAAAQRHGARGVCVDLDPSRIRESRQNADTAGVTARIRFHQGDLFEMDLSEATVVTLYLLPDLNLRLRPKLFEELRPGTRVVSHAFHMGDWEADSMATVARKDGGNSFVYYWVIPADVAGSWTLQAGRGPGERRYALTLDQQHQRLTGRAGRRGDEATLSDAAVVGDSISFTLTDRAAGRPVAMRFSGKVEGNAMRGILVADGKDGSQAWTAARARARAGDDGSGP